MNKKILLTTVSCCAVAAMVATAAQAQTTTERTSQQVTEVMVTAQKRSENVQKVPVAITVIGAAQLTRRGVQDVQDLSQASASLEFTAPSASPGGGGFVRGIGTQSVGAATAAASVGIVLDGVPLGNTNINDLFDLDHVEVLKGPQGTLFGSSVSAGVINIATVAPQYGVYSGYVNEESGFKPLGTYNREVVRAAVNIPIGPDAALRIAAHGYDNNGISKDTYDNKNEDDANEGIRARYRERFGNDITLNLIADFNNDNITHYDELNYEKAPAGTPLASWLTSCGITASSSNVNNCSGFGPYLETKTGGVSAQLDYDLGFATLTSITSYRFQDARSDGDIIGVAEAISLANREATGIPGIVSLQPGYGDHPETTDRNLVTQELRLTSPSNQAITFVGGIYYQHGIYNQDQQSLVNIYLPFPPFFGVINGAPNPTIIETASDDYGVFANATYTIIPGTRLIGGLRYTYSDVSEHDSNLDQAPTPQFVSVNASDVTFRAGLQQDLGPRTMLYFTASSGFKAPEINDSLITGGDPAAPNSQVLFGIKPEEPLSFEVGAKTTLFNGRLNISGDGFYTTVNNFQTQSCVPNPLVGILCGDINVPSVVTKGLEMEVFGRPFANTTLNLSGIYDDATYPKGFLGADDTDMGGQQLNDAPKWKITGSVEQDFPINDVYNVALGVDVTYKAAQSLYLSALPLYRIGDETLVNARLTLESTHNWTVSLFGRNLTNAIYPTSYYPAQAFQPGANWTTIDPNSRRIAGVQAEYKF